MALLSMRIVDADYYLRKPIRNLDVEFSVFRQSKIPRVPVIRIFGATTKGQKTCLHIHRVFPYLYVILPSDVDDAKKFSKKFAMSLDFAIQVALGKSVSNQQQYVYDVELVRKIPFYGYYEEEKDFLQIKLYNPAIVNNDLSSFSVDVVMQNLFEVTKRNRLRLRYGKNLNLIQQYGKQLLNYFDGVSPERVTKVKVSELLINGSVLNQVFQPFETHIPYILQFFIDYNLSGMNLIHIGSAEFRQPLPKAPAGSNILDLHSPWNSPPGSPVYSQTNYSVFNENTVQSYMLLPEDIPKQSTCELEVDCLQSEILNKEYIKDSLGKNPGLALLWEDEKLRRRENHESSIIEIPQSQARDRYEPTANELQQLHQLRMSLEERESRLTQTSHDVLQDDQSMLHESMADEDMSNTMDRNMLDMLIDMPEDEDLNASNTPLSDVTLINNGLNEADGNNTEEENEEAESILMSQSINIHEELLQVNSPNQPSSSGFNLEIYNQPGPSGYKRQISSETGPIGYDTENDINTDTETEEEENYHQNSWSETFIGALPQLDGLDGCNDENSRQKNIKGSAKITLGTKKYTRIISEDRVNIKSNSSYTCYDLKKQNKRFPQLDGNPDVFNDNSSSDEFKPTHRRNKKKRLFRKKKRKKKRHDSDLYHLACDSSKICYVTNKNTKGNFSETDSSSSTQSEVYWRHSNTLRRYPKRTRSLPIMQETSCKKMKFESFLNIDYKEHLKNIYSVIPCRVILNDFRKETVTNECVRRFLNKEKRNANTDFLQEHAIENKVSFLPDSFVDAHSEISQNENQCSPSSFNDSFDKLGFHSLVKMDISGIGLLSPASPNVKGNRNSLSSTSLTAVSTISTKNVIQPEKTLTNTASSNSKPSILKQLKFVTEATEKIRDVVLCESPTEELFPASIEGSDSSYQSPVLKSVMSVSCSSVVHHVRSDMDKTTIDTYSVIPCRIILNDFRKGTVTNDCVRRFLHKERNENTDLLQEHAIENKVSFLPDSFVDAHGELSRNENQCSPSSFNDSFDKLGFHSPVKMDISGIGLLSPASPNVKRNRNSLSSASLSAVSTISTKNIMQPEKTLTNTANSNSKPSISKQLKFVKEASEQIKEIVLCESPTEELFPASIENSDSSYQSPVLKSVSCSFVIHDVRIDADKTTIDTEDHHNIPTEQNEKLGPNENLVLTENEDTLTKSVMPQAKTAHILAEGSGAIIQPKNNAPSREYIVGTLIKYGLPERRFEEAYYSNDKDAEVDVVSVHSGQHVAVGREKVEKLPTLTSSYSGSIAKLQEQQIVKCQIENDLLIGNSDYSPTKIHTFLNDDNGAVITPCKPPPKVADINEWLTFSKLRKVKCEIISKQTSRASKESDKSLEKSTVPSRFKNSQGFSASKLLEAVKKSSLTPRANVVSNSQALTRRKANKPANISLFSLIQASDDLPKVASSQYAPSHTPKDINPLEEVKHTTLVSQVSEEQIVKPKDAINKSQNPTYVKSPLLRSPKSPLSPYQLWNNSEIQGMTPNNTYGFNVTNQNTKVAKSMHVEQHLTIISIELHFVTRRNLKPDPAIDGIAAIFYYCCKDASKPEEEKIHESGMFLCKDVETDTTSKSGKGEDLEKTLLRRAGINCKSFCFGKEVDMLLKFADFIQEMDPDIFLGYEVQMLSWGYLIERAATLEINMCQRLSRIPDKGYQIQKSEQSEEWYGQLISVNIAGRIILNVWRVMRSEVTLQIYTFENVMYHVLHQRVPKYSFRSLSDWWHTNTERWRVIDYYFKRCQGNVGLLDKIDFINRTSELARVFGILFYAVISRGSQFRVESMMLRIAKPLNFVPVSPSVQQRAKMAAPECIPLVMEPESRFYVDPVVVLDFQSLYPSIIIGYNYCYSTCLGRVQGFSNNEYYRFGSTSMHLPFHNIKKLADKKQIHVSPNGVAFVTEGVRRGILPRMLEEILSTRIMVKGAMKKAKSDKLLNRMLDSRQLGLKLIANVTYGYTSANFSGRMPCIEIGDSVVRKGRETLERAIQLVNTTKQWNARVVYGDTDSMFVLLKGASKETAFRVGKEIVDQVTALNPKPVKLKFEKVYQPCVLITKKRYVGYMYETLDQKEPVFDAKGIETVRRDNCPAVGKIMEKSLRLLFEKKDVSLVKAYVQKQFMKIIEGNVTLKDYTFAKEYRGMSSYKPGACVPALMLTRKMLKQDRRSEPRIGERVPYVVIHGTPGLPLIQLVRRPHEVMEDPALRINGVYYITKQICPSLSRIFSLIGVNVDKWFSDLPKITRIQDRELEMQGKKKGTISHYFNSSHCPICQKLTNQKICRQCKSNPQETIVNLAARIRMTERRHIQLTELCKHCSGCRFDDSDCISLDCPVFYKVSNIKRDLNRSKFFRELIMDF